MGRLFHSTAYQGKYLGEGQNLKLHHPVYDNREFSNSYFSLSPVWEPSGNGKTGGGIWKLYGVTCMIWLAGPKIQSSIEQTGLCPDHLISCRVQVHGPGPFTR